MRIRTILPVIAVLVAACGGGNAEPTTTTTSPPASTITLPPDTQPPTTPPPSTTTTTTTPVVEPDLVPVYFFHESGGNGFRVGPFLMPAARNAATLEDAVSQLLNGLTPSEIEFGLSSEIPTDTIFHSIEVDGQTATVDLSSAFEAGGGTLSMTGRLAQLVFTVTGQDPSITAVRLELDGAPVEVFSGEGLILDDPMTRDSFQDLVPGILIETPAFDQWTDAPIVVEGIAAAFEGVFQLEILDADGNVVADVPFVQTDNGVGWGNFSVTFGADQLPPMPADLSIRVWEFSAQDGSVISERIQPFGYRSAP